MIFLIISPLIQQQIRNIEMLGTEQSTKFKPNPLLVTAKKAASYMTIVFILLTAILYFVYPEHRAASLVSSLFIVAFQFPLVVYWCECSRLDKLRLELKQSKSQAAS